MRRERSDVPARREGHRRRDATTRERVVAHLESGKRVTGDALLYTVGRQANTDLLEPRGRRASPPTRAAASRSTSASRPRCRTSTPPATCIGFPALASTSMEQGRLATCHMFGLPAKPRAGAPALRHLHDPRDLDGRADRAGSSPTAKVPYEVGIARYEELARGQMIGDDTGLLKLLFDPRDAQAPRRPRHRRAGATELVHIGQAVLALGGTIEYFRDTVFNYPTLAEAYKVAALNGFNRI